MTYDNVFEIGGSRYRVILHGNSVSAPYQGWSDFGYDPLNNHCTREWFEERLTGGPVGCHDIPPFALRKADRENLIEAILRAFEEYKRIWSFRHFERTLCLDCKKPECDHNCQNYDVCGECGEEIGSFCEHQYPLSGGAE